MARYNSVNSTGSVTQGSSIASPASGLLTTITTGSGTTNLPNPVLYAGSVQTFYNATVAAITLSTPSGNITGPGTGGTQTISLPAGSVITLTSDGTNYIAQAWQGGPIAPTSITASGTITANSTVTFNPSNANISIQPTGTGTVTINPTVTGALDNIVIGANTAKAGTFTTVNTTNTLTTTGITISTGGGTNIANTVNIDTNGSGQARYYSHGSNASTAGGHEWHNASSNGVVDTIAMYLTPAGYLGVGISPVQPLHVTNSAYQNAALTYAPASSTSTYSSLRGRVDGTYGWELDQFGSTYPASDYAQPYGTALVNVLSGPLILGTSNLARLTISAAGFVGIETLTPQAELDLKGNLLVRKGIFVSESAATTIAGDNVNWHHIGYAGGANYHITGSTLGDLTIGAIPGSNIVFGTITTGGSVPVQRLTIAPSGAVTIAQTLQVNANLTANNTLSINSSSYLSVSGGSYMSFYTFAVYGGNQYMHFKTNLRNTTSQMYVIEARGYDYGSGSSIAGNWCGYMYNPNGVSNPISNSVSNWGNQAFCSNQYLSTDGYLVLVGNMASYYCSCTFNSYSTAQGIFSMQITATSQITTSTGGF